MMRKLTLGVFLGTLILAMTLVAVFANAMRLFLEDPSMEQLRLLLGSP